MPPLLAFILLFTIFIATSAGNKWELVPYCETQGGNMIFGMKIISTKNKEWRRITPRDVIQVQPQDSDRWIAYRYDGTVLDKNGEYIVRLKHILQNRYEEALYYTYPRKYAHSSLVSKLNDGSIRIRLQDGITKQHDQEVDPGLPPQQHFWVSSVIDVFGPDTVRGKKPAERVSTKRKEWRPLKIESNDVVAKSVDPNTGEVNQHVIDIKPKSKYYPDSNHCKPVHEETNQKDKHEEESTVTFQTDDEEIDPLRSNNAYAAYHDLYEDEYYGELVEEMESQTQRAYRQGFYAGYRNARKLQK